MKESLDHIDTNNQGLIMTNTDEAPDNYILQPDSEGELYYLEMKTMG